MPYVKKTPLHKTIKKNLKFLNSNFNDNIFKNSNLIFLKKQLINELNKELEEEIRRGVSNKKKNQKLGMLNILLVIIISY